MVLLKTILATARRIEDPARLDQVCSDLAELCDLDPPRKTGLHALESLLTQACEKASPDVMEGLLSHVARLAEEPSRNLTTRPPEVQAPGNGWPTKALPDNPQDPPPSAPGERAPFAPLQSGRGPAVPAPAPEGSPAPGKVQDRRPEPQAAPAAPAPSLPEWTPRVVTVPLFPNAADQEPDLRNFPSCLLPAPGASAGEEAVSAWGAGRPWSPQALVVRLGSEAMPVLQKLMDFETELAASSRLLLERHRVVRVEPRAAEDEACAWFARVAAPLGVPRVLHVEAACGLFAAALGAVLEDQEPERAASLASLKADLVFGSDLALALTQAAAVERAYLKRGPGTGPGKQIILGAAHPDAALSEGYAFARTAFLTLTGLMGPAEGCQMALFEIRQAQLLAAQRDFPLGKFEAEFLADPLRPPESYSDFSGEPRPAGPYPA